MSLQTRQADFDAFCRCFTCLRPTGLVAAHSIQPSLFSRLRGAAALYLSSCLPGRPPPADEADLICAFEAQRDSVLNMTPNGLMVPKRETTLEYNGLVRAFAEIVDSLGAADWIASWHIINIRVKYGETAEAHLQRARPTELIHSDSWTGQSSISINTHVPLFGDVAGNRLAYYAPPAEFKERWLGRLSSFAEGATFASRYAPVDFVPRAGQIVLSDFAALHATRREPGAGTRISIDTSFRLRRRAGAAEEEWLESVSAAEYFPHEALASIGRERLFVFPDRMQDELTGARPGHSAHLFIRNLFETEAVTGRSTGSMAAALPAIDPDARSAGEQALQRSAA